MWAFTAYIQDTGRRCQTHNDASAYTLAKTPESCQLLQRKPHPQYFQATWSWWNGDWGGRSTVSKPDAQTITCVQNTERFWAPWLKRLSLQYNIRLNVVPIESKLSVSHAGVWMCDQEVQEQRACICVCVCVWEREEQLALCWAERAATVMLNTSAGQSHFAISSLYPHKCHAYAFHLVVFIAMYTVCSWRNCVSFSTVTY